MAYFIFFISLFTSTTLLANVRGSDLQNFNPNSNGLGFVTVYPSETLQPLELNVGAFVNYTTNSLAYSTVSNAPNNQTFSEPNDRLLYSNLHFGLGLIEGWEMGVSAGFINAQDVEQSNFLFSYGDTGVNEIFLTTKVRLVNKEKWGVAAVLGADFDQIKNNPFAGDDAGPTINLEGVLDFRITQSLLWAVNLGYRFRQPGTTIPNTGVTPMSDQFTYSSALAYQTDSKGSALIGEIFGSYPTEEFTLPTDRQLSNLEIIVSYRWRALEAFDIHGGVGTEAYHGLGSPDIRAFLGFNLRHSFLQSGSSSQGQPYKVFQPRALPSKQEAKDSDNDGVPDPIDQCPNTWAQNYVDESGCSKKDLPGKTKVTDTDGDGIADPLDRCMDTPPGSRVNGFGCEITPYRK